MSLLEEPFLWHTETWSSSIIQSLISLLMSSPDIITFFVLASAHSHPFEPFHCHSPPLHQMPLDFFSSLTTWPFTPPPHMLPLSSSVLTTSNLPLSTQSFHSCLCILALWTQTLAWTCSCSLFLHQPCSLGLFSCWSAPCFNPCLPHDSFTCASARTVSVCTFILA